MKLKRATAILMAGMMAAGMLAGCDGNTGGDSAAKTNETAGTEVSKEDGAAAKTDTAGTAASAETETAEAGAQRFDGVTITVNKDADSTNDAINALAELAKEKLGLTVELEMRVSGADGDNMVKTRLASGDMTDLLWYNSGSKFKALNPAEYFLDLSDQPFAEKLEQTFKDTVSVDGKLYGAPTGASSAGAVMYYKPDYEELGLSVPKTWDEFLENCEKLKAAGKTAMIGTFGDAWTAQVTYLGDNYNVLAADPEFPQKFEAGTAKYGTTPAGVESFQKLADLQGYYNADYLAATYNDGCEMLANGEGTHWIMLTQVLNNIELSYPEVLDDIGIFGVPGEAADNAGLTVWLPGGIYVNKDSKNIDACLAFLDLAVSQEGMDAMFAVSKPVGPASVVGYEMPEDSYQAVKVDMQSFFDEGKTAPALEFQTAVKGANCEQICVEVGSGQVSAQEAADAYDEDCKKMALQLGLNWE